MYIYIHTRVHTYIHSVYIHVCVCVIYGCANFMFLKGWNVWISFGGLANKSWKDFKKEICAEAMAMANATERIAAKPRWAVTLWAGSHNMGNISFADITFYANGLKRTKRPKNVDAPAERLNRSQVTAPAERPTVPSRAQQSPGRAPAKSRQSTHTEEFWSLWLRPSYWAVGGNTLHILLNLKFENYSWACGN